MTAPEYPGQPQQQPNNTMGLIAMIVGIISIPVACCLPWVGPYLGVLAGGAAAVLGFQGKGKADRGEATNRGQALAGIITGIIGAVLGVLAIILIVIADVVDLPTTM